MALRSRAFRVGAAVVILLAAALITAVYFFMRKEPPVDRVESTGVIEATEVEITSKVAGRIEWLCCEEGGRVKAGQAAVRLESDELKARVEEARAAVEEASEAVKEAKVSLENARVQAANSGYELKAAQAEVERARAVLEDSRENLRRAEGLFKEGFIARKDLDAARTSFDSYRAQADSAKARRQGAEGGLRSARVNIRAAEARIASAEAKKAQAQARLAVFAAQLDDTTINSPIGGVVAYKAFETGEFISPGASVYTVDDLDNIWARVDIEETRIEKIRLGSRAEIIAAGVPEKAFAGKVIEVGEVGGFATQRDVTRGRSDIKTFRVKASVERPEGFLKPGMTVRVRIFFR